MQQLNILPMKVSKNIGTKDDVTTFTSAPFKNEFSQHIDQQLSKNKGVVDDTTKIFNENVEIKADKALTESNKLSAQENPQKRVQNSQTAPDKTEPAIKSESVAAIGKKDTDVSKKPVNERENTNKAVDDPELLMSFFSQADKTLLDESVREKKTTIAMNISENSGEQKAKVETTLLLKSSDLVAELSSVAKAVTSTAEIQPEGSIKQEKAVNSLSDNRLVIEPTALNKADNVSNKAIDKITDQALDGGKLTKNGTDKVTKESGIHPEVNAIQLANGGTTDKVDESEKQAGLTQQGQNTNTQNNVMSTSNNTVLADAIVEPAKLLSTTQTTTLLSTQMDTKSAIEIETKVDEATAALIKNENTSTKLAENVMTTDVKAQSSVIKSHIVSSSVAQTTNKDVVVSVQESIVEPIVEESATVESEVELNTKSIDKLIEQNKALVSDENKNPKVQLGSTVNTDPSINSGNFIGEATKERLAAYDRIEQDSAEAIKLTGNADVAQNQKTNTQLHQETISIFRRDFSEAVKDKVMLMISQKLQQFDITLDPPELGNMQVRVNLQGEQATVNFIVQNQQTKESLEQNMHKLRDLLAEQGVDVGDANVEQQSQQSDKEESLSGHQEGFTVNTGDASDTVEHDLSVKLHDPTAKVVDYYA